MTSSPPVPAADPTAAWGDGLATRTAAGAVLDVWFPQPALGAPDPQTPVPSDLAAAAGADPVRGVTTEVVRVELPDLAAPPADAADAYLRLHLLSHRLVLPRSINVDGIFGLLSNVVWTNARTVRGGGLRADPAAAAGRRHRRSRCTASTSSRG